MLAASERAQGLVASAGADPHEPLLSSTEEAPRAATVAHVTLVLPCLNEEEGVGRCVRRARQVFERSGLDGHVLVVDNGSQDGSIAAAKAAGARVIRQAERGYGAALRSGIEYSDTEYVVMADADGTYVLDAIPRLLQPLIDDEADLVLGARLGDANPSSMPWLHRFVGSPILTMLVNRAADKKIRVSDSQSGFRAFRRDQFMSLPMTSTGMEFASEMLIRFAWARLRITEVETTYAPRIGESKLESFPDGLRHVRQILLLSPDIFAIDPGLIMTGLAMCLWTVACLSAEGLGRVGSLSWVAILIAEVLAVIGPITYCTGLLIRYRAQTLGLRHSPPKRPISSLVWRCFFVGVGLVGLAFSLVVLVVVNFHNGQFISYPVERVLVSVAGSAAIVGVVLSITPVLSPFLLQGPAYALPPAQEDA